MEAYERSDQRRLIGDTSHFAREDEVEAAWAHRRSDPEHARATPVNEYLWAAGARRLRKSSSTGPCSWHNPGAKAHSWTRACGPWTIEYAAPLRLPPRPRPRAQPRTAAQAMSAGSCRKPREAGLILAGATTNRSSRTCASKSRRDAHRRPAIRPVNRDRQSAACGRQIRRLEERGACGRRRPGPGAPDARAAFRPRGLQALPRSLAPPPRAAARCAPAAPARAAGPRACSSGSDRW